MIKKIRELIKKITFQILSYSVKELTLEKSDILILKTNGDIRLSDKQFAKIKTEIKKAGIENKVLLLEGFDVGLIKK